MKYFYLCLFAAAGNLYPIFMLQDPAVLINWLSFVFNLAVALWIWLIEKEII